jgi:glyoxylase-like metal-dependent hydrolase (beta-lactamase superfamily II)
MKVTRLEGHHNVYTCNVYLVTGSWRRIHDINTLIDVGSDPSILESIERINVGAGKKKIDQVVLTHSHSDHTAALGLIGQTYSPKVLAFSPFLKGVNHIVKDGESIRIGDRLFEIIHAPGHTEDSISLYCEEESVLFVGDSPVIIHAAGGTYEEGFVRSLEKLCRRRIETIYFGHGEPLFTDARTLLQRSLRNARASMKQNATASRMPKGGQNLKTTGMD